jgi:hypothetical protein
MDLARLKRLLEAHGAEPLRWPARERAAALDLLASSPAAREALAEASRLDALLGAVPAEDPAAAAALRARIAVATAPVTPRNRARAAAGWSIGPWPLRRLWPHVMGVAAAAVIGFVVGFGQPAAPAGADPDPGDLAGLMVEAQP